jgi:PAS domain S-box-containing protein
MTNATAPIRLLIVDDDEDDFILTSEKIKGIAGRPIDISWCPRYADALKHMRARDYDLYFVDYFLGAKSGVDLLKEAINHNCEEPIILLTGKGNRAVDIEAMQLGAVDYLLKDELTVEKMERSIRYALERASTMKALKDNERKYRGIFEKSKDIVFLTDELLNFKDVNHAAESMLGYTEEELLKMNLCDLIDQTYHKEGLLQYLQNRGEIDDWEVVFVAANGDRKSCTLSASMETDSLATEYVQGIIHDITNLKKIEKATLQAEKLAAAGRLVRTLAHEVRNPLNNITLSAEQMIVEAEDEQGNLYLNIIQRNAKRISDLISELLNTSRPTEIMLEPRQVQTLIDEVLATAIDRITLKRIKLSLDYPPEPLFMMADAEKLKIALLNIMINAIEAMEGKQGALAIKVVEEGDVAILTVSDNGCGISEEHVSRLFEPYFTQKRNGMGLGLAFTLNIIQGHKGRVEVQSVVGEGTTFVITFPLIDDGEG